MTAIHVVLMQAEGDVQESGCTLVNGPHGGPLIAPMTDDLRSFVGAMAARFPGIKYTICKLVEVESATHVH